METKAIILCGGEGKRLGESYKDTPKCLVQINDRPLLTYVLKSLSNINVKNIIVLTNNHEGHLKRISEFLELYSQDFNIQLISSPSKSTAEAVKISATYLDEPFMCLHGNMIISPNHLEEFFNVVKRYPSSLVGMGSKINNAPTHPRLNFRDDYLVDIVPPAEEKLKPHQFASLEFYYCPTGTLYNLQNTLNIDKTMFALTLRNLVKKAEPSFVIEHKEEWFHLATPQDMIRNLSEFNHYF